MKQNRGLDKSFLGNELIGNWIANKVGGKNENEFRQSAEGM